MGKTVADIITSLESNKKLSLETKSIIYRIVKEFVQFTDKFENEINLDNLCNLLESLDQKKSENCEGISYDVASNSINIFKSSNQTYDENGLNSYIKSILSMITTIHNPDNTISQGVKFSKNGVEYGAYLTDLMEDRLIEINYGNPESDKPIILYGCKDTIFSDLQSIVGANKILFYLFNGQGEALFDDIANRFGDEKRAENFFGTIEKYGNLSKNSIEEIRKNDNSYLDDINFLKTMQKNNGFNMA